VRVLDEQPPRLGLDPLRATWTVVLVDPHSTNAFHCPLSSSWLFAITSTSAGPLPSSAPAVVRLPVSNWSGVPPAPHQIVLPPTVRGDVDEVA
jgi:hypothetical protein